MTFMKDGEGQPQDSMLMSSWPSAREAPDEASRVTACQRTGRCLASHEKKVVTTAYPVTGRPHVI